MSPLATAAATGAFTAFFGIVVFVLGQITLKFFIERIHEQANVIGEISEALPFYANVSKYSPPERLEQADATYRKLAARLRATLYTVPFYDLFARLRVVRAKTAVVKAAQGLIGLSNTVRAPTYANEHRTAVIEGLGIDWID